MKLTKKFFRVHFKIWSRSFLKSPQSYAFSSMAVIVCFCSLLSIYQAWKHHNYLKQSTFSAWEGQQKKFIGRILASKAESCNNTYDIDVLESQVKGLEATYETGHIVKGSWQGINLESLPAIQAQMLTEFGKLIGNQKIASNFEGCGNIICIINRVYGDQDPAIGYMVYYWYLKTGSMLSLSNLLPNQESNYPGVYDGKNYDMQEYLFTKDEIKKFYQLAKSLPENFLNIPLVKSFHKIPYGAPLDPKSHPNGCSLATARGEILFTAQCLAQDDFFLTATHEIAKFIDLHQGNKVGEKSISSSSEWADLSFWLREDYWDPTISEYQFKWLTHLTAQQHISHRAGVSPSEQLAQLLAHFRFQPHEFYQRTPPEIIQYVSNNFYKGMSFDPKGLLKQYLNASIKKWDREEGDAWQKCFDRHLGDEKSLDFKNLRDVASTIRNPLFACVEKEQLGFADKAAEELKGGNAEGCDFFSGSEYNFYTREFFDTLNQYTQEKIIQRKLELKEFGPQVVWATKAKKAFIESFDPTSIYINCYGDENVQKCFEDQMRNLASSAVGKYSKLKGHYKKIITEELTYLYKYEDIANKTNSIVKKFLTPFNYKVHQTAKVLWENCKTDSKSYSSQLELPMSFTGGRHYVKASLLNCINENLQSSLDTIVDAGAFQIINDEKVVYKLNKSEKKFALEFLELRFKNELSSLLENQRILEVNYLVSHFKDIRKDALATLERTTSIFKNIYTQDHVQDKCVEAISDHYPKDYFYFTKKELDKSQGRSICSTFLSDPEAQRKVNIAVERNWERNKDQVDEWFMDEYKSNIGTCFNDYPLNEGAGNRNARMLKICLEDAFATAYATALDEWKADGDYKYFTAKEGDLTSFYQSRRQELLQQAWDGKIKPGRFHFITKWF